MKTLGFWFYVFLLLSGCLSKSSPKPSSPLAEIRWPNDLPSQLSLSDFQLKLALALGVYDSISLRNPVIISQTKRRVLQDWLLEQLVTHHLQELQLLPQAADIEKEKMLWQAQWPDHSSWQLALIEAKLNDSQLNEVIFKKLLFDRFFSWLQSVESFEFDQIEIETFYKTSPKDDKTPESLKLAQILVKQRDQAEDIKRLIESGAISFEQAAQRFSISPEGQIKNGLLGWIDKGDDAIFDPLFDKSIRVSPKSLIILESSWGVHLVKIIAYRPARKLDLKTSTPQILQQLRQQKEQGLYLKWLTKTLESVKISINYPLIEAIEVKLKEEGI